MRESQDPTVCGKSNHFRQEDLIIESPEDVSDLQRWQSLGSSIFPKFRTSKTLYIDKSLFIKEFLSGSACQVILRPRRFGKSLNLSMLKYFLSHRVEKSYQRQLFENLEIWSYEQICNAYMGQYSVVLLDFKICSGTTWNDALMCIRGTLIGVLMPIWNDVKDDMRIWFPNSSTGKGPGAFIEEIHPIELRGFLGNLAKSLLAVYGKRTIILVDEYDTPLNADFETESDREQTLDFFSKFYTNAFKSNEAVEMACLVGIVEIRGSNIFSELNNLETYSIASTELYSSSFGFTEEEVRRLLVDGCGMSADQASNAWNRENGLKDWYMGYQMGNALVVNPWTLMNCLHSGLELQSYWCRTTARQALYDTCKSNPGFADCVAKLFPELMLLNERTDSRYQWIPVEAFAPDISVHTRATWTSKQVLHFLCMTGYLTYRKRKNICKGERFEGEVRIPNKELYKEWENCLANMSGEGSIVQLCVSHDDILKALTDLDEVAIRETLEKRLQVLSDKNPDLEHVYQLFSGGILNCIGRVAGWKIEVGVGMGSMVIENANFTVIVNNDKSALGAIEQILLRQYYKTTPVSHQLLAIGCVIVTGGPRRIIKMRAVHIPPGDCASRDRALDIHIATEKSRPTAPRIGVRSSKRRRNLK